MEKDVKHNLFAFLSSFTVIIVAWMSNLMSMCFTSVNTVSSGYNFNIMCRCQYFTGDCCCIIIIEVNQDCFPTLIIQFLMSSWPAKTNVWDEAWDKKWHLWLLSLPITASHVWVFKLVKLILSAVWTEVEQFIMILTMEWILKACQIYSSLSKQWAKWYIIYIAHKIPGK